MMAVLFVASTALYSVTWMVCSQTVPVHLGVTYDWKKPGEAKILTVARGSPAERAGLRAGDRIIGINGRKLDDPVPFAGYPFYKYVTLGANGDRLELDVKRGQADELVLRPVLQPFKVKFGNPSLIEAAVLRVVSFYPVFYLIVGATVLFLRLEDWNAWRLALLFAGFIAEAPLSEANFPHFLRGFGVSYHTLLAGLASATFYWFFSVFPVPSPIDRKLPYLKSISFAAMAAYSVPLALACLFGGDRSPIFRLFGWEHRTTLDWIVFFYSVALYGLGFISLIWNSVRPASADARRKTRVIVWGTLVGFGPVFLLSVIGAMFDKGLDDYPFWIWTMAVLATMLMPVSYAYAVVKDRVLEIPVLLRRSARYLIVQRGFVVGTLLISLAAILLFIALFTHFFQRHGNVAIPASLSVGVVFGIVSVIANLQVVPRVTKRIDRAFFRNAYDTREVLEHLARKTRTAGRREQLAEMLESEINQALHPATIALFLWNGNNELKLQRNNGRGEVTALPDAPVLEELARRGEPMDVRHELSATHTQALTWNGVNPECLVPILSGRGELTGVIALGMRLSEEPYSSEDKRLLNLVAMQAGAALDNISLAEEMAAKMDAEHRITQEMAFARQVQARLLPQKQPRLATLEYAGGCIQARQVGGDYYDFLELRPGRVGLVLADIAGKGVSGALLMANLQANLRSQYAMALENLGGLLKSVNRLFYENTSDTSYATLFFSEYDDATRRLRYVNCGHLPPLILRGSGRSNGDGSTSLTIDRLEATSTVLGLFQNWDCSVGEVELRTGDVLVIYTDGVTEAPNSEWEEFGESRLIETMKTYAQLPAAGLLQTIVGQVEQFSGGEQEDDITLIVGRCTSCGTHGAEPVR
jgi:phosphoserine phosphatase RsbU/P